MKVTQSQLLTFIGGAVIVPFAVNVASDTWRGNEWIWGSLGFLAVIAIFLVPSDGWLRRHKYGQARWVRLIALVLLICYPFIVWTLSHSHGLLAVLTPALFLWAASVLLLWTSSGVSAPQVAAASAYVLFALVALHWAVVDLQQGSTADGVLNLIAGVGLSVASAGLIRDSPKLATVGALLVRCV
jgi:hypothetical protein